MIKKYVYNGVEYANEYQVRRVIGLQERKAFSAEPEEGKAEFWASHGVTYKEEEEPLETLISRKLSALDRAFMSWRNNGAVMISSLGFAADADERAMIDIAGLVTLNAPAVFMDANNQPHNLSADEIKVLQAEVVQSGNDAYQQKWAYRQQITACTSKEELDAVEIAFTASDFREGKNVQ